MFKNKVIYILAVLIASACFSRSQSLPTFEEMWSFCETAAGSLEKHTLAPPIIKNAPITEIKQVQEIYLHEKKDLQRIAVNFKSRSSKQKNKQEKLEKLIDLGLFNEALQYLQSGEYVKPKGDYAFEYYLHLAFLQRWLGKEQEHVKAFREAQANIAKIDRKRKRKAGKLKKKAKTLKEYYEKKYYQWVHFSEKFQEYGKQVREEPDNQDAWENFAEYATSLGYRLEEIVARRVIYRLAYNRGELSPQEVVNLALAYLKTYQPGKCKEITEAALKNTPTPLICAIQVKACIMQENDAKARKEFRRLHAKFPEFHMKFNAIEKKDLSKW